MSLFAVIPLQATTSIAIYVDPACCPGGDWRAEIYQAAAVGIGAFKVTIIFGDPAPSDQKYRYLK